MGKKKASGNNDMTAILNQLQKTYSVDSEDDVFESESVYEDTELSDLLAKIISENTSDDNDESDDEETLDLSKDVPSEAQRKTKKSKKTSGGSDVSTDIQNIIMSEEYISVLRDCEADLQDDAEEQASKSEHEIVQEDSVDETDKEINEPIEEPTDEPASDLVEELVEETEDTFEQPLPWDDMEQDSPVTDDITLENINNETPDADDDLTFGDLDDEENEADDDLTFGDLDDEEPETDDDLTFGDLGDEENEADDDLTFGDLDDEEPEADDDLTFGDLDDEEPEADDDLTFGDLDDEEPEADDDLTFGDLDDEEPEADDDLTFGDLDNEESEVDVVAADLESNMEDAFDEPADIDIFDEQAEAQLEAEPESQSEIEMQKSSVADGEKKLYYTVLEKMDFEDTADIFDNSVAAVEETEEPEEIEEIREVEAPPKVQEDAYIVLSKEFYTDDPLQWHLDSAQASTVNEDTEEEVQEPLKKSAEIHDDDISLLLQLGYKDELNTEVGHERTDSVVQNIKNSYRPDKNKIPFGFCGKEFFEGSQIDKIKQKYDYDKRVIIIKIALFSCISLVLMLLGIIFKSYSTVGSVVMFSVMELLIISLGCVVIYRDLLAGIRGIFKFSPTLFTMPIISLLLLALFDIFNIVTSLLNPERMVVSSMTLFGFTTSVFVIFALVSQLINCVREQKTFNLISASEDLYTAETLVSQKSDKTDANNLRSHEIRKQVKGNAVCVKKTKYISEYFKRCSESSYGIGNVILALGVVPLAAMILACIIIATRHTATDVASTIVFAFYMCLSASFVLIMPVTLFAASQSLARKKCGIIGTGAVAEYAHTNSVIFPDTSAFEVDGDIEVIPFGDTDINASMKTAHRLFSALDGTLSAVVRENAFNKDGSVSQADINIAFINDNGVELYMDNDTHILLGNDKFISEHRKRLNFEACDLIPSAVSAGREVVYLAINGVVSLGYIMPISVKKEFTDKVKLLAQHNVKAYVSTYEPHIKVTRYNDCKIGVYRPYEHKSHSMLTSRRGGIIASGDAKNITYPLIMTSEVLKSVRKSSKMSLWFVLAGIVISFVITLVGYLAPNAMGILRHRDILTVIIQLFSAIPLTISAIKLWKKYK